MTRPDAQLPTPAPSATEVEYVRKLSLAILSTLQAKGLLSADEVDAILIAARRAAQGVPPTAAAPRAEAAPTMQVTVQPAPSLTFHAHARAPQAEPEAPADAVEASVPAASGEEAVTDGQPLPEAGQPTEPLAVEAPTQPIALGPDVVEDPSTPSAPLGTEAQDVPQASGEGSVAMDATPEELEVEPPAQTIVIGPDEVEGEASPDAPAAADDLVLDGAAATKPAEEPKPSPAVPTFDLKLD